MTKDGHHRPINHKPQLFFVKLKYFYCYSLTLCFAEVHKRRKSLRKRFDSFSKEKKERGKCVVKPSTVCGSFCDSHFHTDLMFTTAHVHIASLLLVYSVSHCHKPLPALLWSSQAESCSVYWCIFISDDVNRIMNEHHHTLIYSHVTSSIYSSVGREFMPDLFYLKMVSSITT